MVDPVTPATVYAGERTTGIFKSVDGGTTWAAANTGFNGPIIQIWALAIDPATPATLYASASTSNGQGLYKTIDGGAHWSNILPVNSVVIIQSLAVDPQASSTVYVGTSDGKVLRSINGGANFSPVTTGLPGYGMTALAINPQSSGTVYGGSTNGVFKTTNSGAAWTASNNGLALTAVNSVAVDPTTPTTIYAGTRFSGIFKSIDGGGSWTSIYTGLGTTGNLACVVPNVSSIVIDPNTPGRVYAGTQCTASNQVLKSIDAGATWLPAATGLPFFGGILSLAIDPLAPATLYAGSSGSGLFLTIDSGAHWTSVGDVPSTGVPALAIAVVSTSSVGRSSQKMIRSDAATDGGHPSPSGTGTGSVVIAGTNGQGAYMGPALGPLAPVTLADPDMQDCIDDATSFWAPVTENDHTLKLLVEGACHTIIPDSPGAPKGSNGVSLRSGASRSSQRTGSSGVSGPLGQPASSFVATAWDAPNGNAGEVSACSPVKAVAGNPFDPTSFYVGAACGVLRATNLGAQLVTVNSTGLPTNPNVNALGIAPAGNTIYAGTSNGGVYQYTFPPQPPTQLGITSVNGGASPAAGFPFNVVVQAQAADLSPQVVVVATTVQLSIHTGTGTLGGAQSCQIPAGSGSCTVTGVTYSQAEIGVVLTATRTGGDSLAAGDSAPFDVAIAGTPPTFVSAASRKVHGTAGTFDLVLNANPLTPSTETRAGPAYAIVFKFDKPVTGGTASVSESAAVAGTPTFSGSEMTVPLTGVVNPQYVTVNVSGVTASDGGSGGAGTVRIGFLFGDANQTRQVTVADVGIVNAALLQTLTSVNFLYDVNVDGKLTVADKGLVNANLLKKLPAP